MPIFGPMVLEKTCWTCHEYIISIKTRTWHEEQGVILKVKKGN